MNFSDRIRRVSDLPRHLPCFPLVGAVLLPRAVLPLHIFEPRYLAMIDAVLASTTRLLAMIQPAGDGGETGSPLDKEAPLRRVGCVARLTSFREVEGGRMLIELTGVCRFEPSAEVEASTPYRIVEADYARFADDLSVPLVIDEADRARLLSTLDACRQAGKLQGDWQAITRMATEPLVAALVMSGPHGPSERQAMLEAPTLSERIDILVQLVAMDLARTASEGGSQLQ